MANDRVLRALGLAPEPPLPAHLVGIPPSLLKYEPLLRQAYADASPLNSAPSRAKNSSSIIG